uniref:Uncharacterized protein n=1 Tax=Oryza rufipogon TaxID=4529 RepID=A0A0E0Q186_ORYRU
MVGAVTVGDGDPAGGRSDSAGGSAPSPPSLPDLAGGRRCPLPPRAAATAPSPPSTVSGGGGALSHHERQRRRRQWLPPVDSMATFQKY